MVVYSVLFVTIFGETGFFRCRIIDTLPEFSHKVHYILPFYFYRGSPVIVIGSHFSFPTIL